jgi:hypothetical protein
MTEPSTIEYISGASWYDLNVSATENHVRATCKVAVELSATLCKEFSLDQLADGVILSHSEGHRRGIATNHADVEHIWNRFGLTMNGFRRGVKNALDALNGTDGGNRQPGQEVPGTPDVPDVSSKLTQVEFDVMMECWLRRRAALPASDWAKETWARSTPPQSSTFDGSAPQGFLTREQAAVVAERLGITI